MRTRFWFLFGLALVLAVATFIGSAIYQSRRMAIPTVEWTGLSPLVDYVEAETRARARAQAWSADVVLIGVEASWRPGVEWLQTEYLPVSWAYTYYSPGQKAIATVGVSGETVSWVPPLLVEQTFEAIAPFPVPQGPNVAWLAFRASGGEDFLRAHSKATVSLRLRQVAGTPRWDILAVDQQASWRVRVNALSGAALPQN